MSESTTEEIGQRKFDRQKAEGLKENKTAL